MLAKMMDRPEEKFMCTQKSVYPSDEEDFLNGAAVSPYMMGSGGQMITPRMGCNASKQSTKILFL
jgi:hypothetical protein